MIVRIGYIVCSAGILVYLYHTVSYCTVSCNLTSQRETSMHENS